MERGGILTNTLLICGNPEILIPDYNDVDEPDGEQAFRNYMIYGGIWLLKVDEQSGMLMVTDGVRISPSNCPPIRIL